MSNWYYYDAAGRKVGPIPANVLKSLAEQGVINAGTTVETEDGRTAAAGSVKGLIFAPFQPPAVAVPLPPAPMQQPVTGDELLGMKPNTFFMAFHLSQLLFFFAPYILWALANDCSPKVKTHGKNVLNWQLSYFIYLSICVMVWWVFWGYSEYFNMGIDGTIAAFVGLVGAFFCLALPICAIVFSVQAAIKGGEGEAWVYLMSIQFYKNDDAKPPSFSINPRLAIIVCVSLFVMLGFWKWHYEAVEKEEQRKHDLYMLKEYGVLPMEK